MKIKAVFKQKYRDTTIFLSVLLITTYLLPQNSLEDTWIILPTEINPYKSSELNQKEASVKLKFPQETHGVLLGDEQLGIVKILIGDKNYYLPVRLLLKKINLQSNQDNLLIGEEKVDINTPLPYNYEPDDLEKIDQKWNYHRADYPKYVRKDAAAALVKMFDEAKKQGLSLKVVSAYRAFSKQRLLYLNAIKKNGIEQNAVAKPGHSEHQLGTTVDVSSFSSATVLNESFGDTKEGKWMKENAHKFGFYQSYTIDNSKVSGYIPEPWHYRYIGK